jgi:hypothetical protein
MPNASEAQIKNRIAEFVHELDLLVRKSALESLQGVLGNGARPARRGPGRPAKIVTGTGRRGRQPADLGDATAKVADYVKSNDGQGIGAIAQATGIDLKVAKKAALRLLAEGGLKKSGAKRGTVYHVGSGRPARTAKKGRRKA